MPATAVPSFTLNNGTSMPAIGLGCWMGGLGGGQRVVDMCEKALKVGYRHFDTASGYGNEKQVGDAIRSSGVPREEIFLTTKLSNASHHRVREAFEDSLNELNCGYIDLYLLHWPIGIRPGTTTNMSAMVQKPDDMLSPGEAPTFVDTWKEMEKLLETGKVRSIGVSNFSVKTLSELIPHCKTIPAVNQVELHPCLPQEELHVFCDSKGIHLTAYSPLGRFAFLHEEPTIMQIAKQNAVSTAQVILSWIVQSGISAVPKSENIERMSQNMTLLQLSEADTQIMNEIHKQKGMHKSLLVYHGPGASALGWSYEQLGWNMVAGAIVPT